MINTHYESHSKSDSTSQKPRKKKRCKNNFTKFFWGVGPCVWSFASWAHLCCSTRYSQDQMNNKKSPNRLNHRDIQRPFQHYKNCLVLAPEKEFLPVQLWDYPWPVYNYLQRFTASFSLWSYVIYDVVNSL